MAHTKEVVSDQVQAERKALLSSEGLPFRSLLSEKKILAAVERCGVEFRERIYTPAVTIWAFLSQVMSRGDASCRDAVSRVVADRVARGKKACSPDTSSYCRARCRLPEKALADLTREIGQELHDQARPEWLLKGRPVVIVDGSTSTADDTPETQKEYPQSRNQKPGLGFPILRYVVLVSLAVGTILDCAVGACRGKKTGEQSLFRTIWNALKAGCILLGDRLFDSYRDVALLKAREVDSVIGKKQSRRCDFRRGRRLGKDDHIVVWKKPKYDASRFESEEEWKALPPTMEMREIRASIRRKGYRTRAVVIVTTLLDEKEFTAKELTDLFAERWNVELDLRSLKRSLGMHHLHCKTPEMVRKELWMHMLAYNLIRVRMAQAAAVHDKLPRSLSFTATKILIHNFAPHLKTTCGAEHLRIEMELLQAIARCRIIKRPGRKEPRAVKKRADTFPKLTKPRAQARKGLPA